MAALVTPRSSSFKKNATARDKRKARQPHGPSTRNAAARHKQKEARSA
jgi:hypothetical protein